ncbi:MAG TPA: carboxypeptidase regulatory-like domain-containing protein [Pyrinomonadaceae bacterium]|nr:carboxypeptidase regulatory-like domain-containing protein [Pyrinomonadaceae bacterium]
MSRVIKPFLVMLVLLLGVAASASAQTTGSISGLVQDEKEAALPNATVTVRNVETNISRNVQTNDEGRYSFANLPVGRYEVSVEAPNFSKYVQTGITLLLNQTAVVDVTMKLGGVSEVVTVTENAALLNTTNAEVSTRFDSRRLSELPIATNRSVYNVALSAPGVSQTVAGQSQFASGIGFSANGGRTRSNNFMIDGQDNNDFGVAGATVGLNNPDLIQEVRLVTNQFSAEYGRNGSAVFNAITKSGTNEYHGSAFLFHNDNALNACNNLDKAGGFCSTPGTPNFKTEKRPFRVENQAGFTVGGPLHLPRFGEGGPAIISGRDRTFFFFSLQRWWDRQLGSGFTINGAPDAAGRAALQAGAGNRPQVAALLKFLPVGSGPCTGSATLCAPATFTANGQTYVVPKGSLTGSTSSALNDWQQSIRIDHNFSEKHTLFGRYIVQDQDQTGAGQATPPGLSQNSLTRSQAVNVSLNSLLSSRVVNELRGAYLRNGQLFTGADPAAAEIPSIEISALGLSGFNAAANRTAIGLAVNFPQFATRQTYQLQDNLSISRGVHNWKFGVDIRRNQLKQFFVPTIRGRLAYGSLQRFIDDIADSASINKPLAGGQEITYYDWHDVFAYGMDEWKVRPNFTLTLGLRYESPGQPIADLAQINDRIVKAAGGDERFRFTPVPKRDKNNFQPRVGFNWNPRTSERGALGFLTGGDKMVIRGGYAVTHDYAFTNIASNIASAFPFLASVDLPTTPQAGGPGVAGAFTTLPTIQGATGLNPNRLVRTIVAEDFRSPYYQQFSLETQRELTRDLVMRIGYVGTKGTGLFQSIDGNPRRIGTATCSESNADTCRVNQIQGAIRLRANAASSIYHSLQLSLEKRLSRSFSAGAHYTWSSFIDTASEIFNPSGAEVAVSQDSFNRSIERARSSFDRPHRFTGNVVYELPFFRDQQGFVGHVLGGWQVNSFFSFQSGSPFTVLQGTDPAGTLAGISGLVGNSVRPNLNTNLPLGQMSIEEIRFAAGATTCRPDAAGVPTAAGAACFFTPVTAAQRVGDAGRNILRTDGINRVDFGILKNTRITESQRIQLRADFFNLSNTRDFGVPEGRINNSNFLNQWGTNGGNRRIIVGLRYVF